MTATKNNKTNYSLKIGLDIHNVLGKKLSGDGHILLKIPTHPNAQSNGYVFEHRVIFESIVGFYLDPEIVIHHINEDKQDNRFANLQMMDKSEHTILHHKGAKRSEETKKRNSIATIKLGWVATNHPNYKNIDKDVKELYSQGVPVAKIAEMTGVTRRTIYNRLKKIGLKG
ncbi:HNH endonuclease [Enterococcus termitis]|uniref:HNH nuclease domain-containing protein n=1 Tax=Enterococcus termitis TaxID=332950 RepID=A0A1E5H015_9ENTE|nr:HNH endonuclease [Enterococcus termitis]OEG18165.1 hypothetical protein BCR25_16880 [Enterococcus termitis]OJG97200.1 hypothetical protein RV18_GL001065 [Enterococcus termitis]